MQAGLVWMACRGRCVRACKQAWLEFVKARIGHRWGAACAALQARTQARARAAASQRPDGVCWGRGGGLRNTVPPHPHACMRAHARAHTHAHAPATHTHTHTQQHTQQPHTHVKSGALLPTRGCALARMATPACCLEGRATREAPRAAAGAMRDPAARRALCCVFWASILVARSIC